MSPALVWDAIGERFYEYGVDHGVLYIPDPVTGAYDEGFAWNGLTTVTESPSGAESSPHTPHLSFQSPSGGESACRGVRLSRES